MKTVRITVDQAVYEYSCYVWGLITDDKPEEIVSALSEGKDLVAKTDSKVQKNIALLIRQANLFLPRVRMEHDYGYASENARWCNSLLMKKRSLKSNVVYYVDVVNNIITKPYHDEIARLRQIISVEQTLQKDGKPLSSEQAAKVADVTAKINEQRKLLRCQPRCTNQILAILLHEYIDTMSPEDADTIRSYESQVANRAKLLENVLAKLEDKAIGMNSEKRLELEAMRNKTSDMIEKLNKQCYEVRAKYYAKFRLEMPPQVIAQQLTKYVHTAWQAFDVNINEIEVCLKISVPHKTAKDDNSEKKSTRKQPTPAERARALMLMPYSIADGQLDSESQADITNDLQVLDEWDQWAKQHRERSYTPEYRQAYEGFRRRLKTIPTKMEQTPQPATTASVQSVGSDEEFSKNKSLLTMFINDTVAKLLYPSDLKEPSNVGYLEEFARRPDFNLVFSILRNNIGSCKKASHALQYIRNVVKDNQTDWSIEPVKKS